MSCWSGALYPFKKAGNRLTTVCSIPIVDIGIVGGGITGLAAAIAFRQTGHRVTVYEQAPKFTEVGAGIALPPNALTCLRILGLRDRFPAHPLSTAPATICDQRGKILVRATLAQFTGGTEFVVAHRAALIDALVSQLPQHCLRPAHTVTAVTSDGRVTTQHDTDSFDLVIAADGVNSVVRQTLWPTYTPRRTGIIAWRWILDQTPDSFGFFLGQHAEFGLLPLGLDKTYAYGGARPGHTDLDAYRNWPAPISHAIAHHDPDRLITNELLELHPPRQLATGAVVLLGDAAHAMRPTFGQGAALGLEDAITLAYHGRAAYLRRRRRMLAMYLASRHGTWFNTPKYRLLTLARNTALQVMPNPIFTALVGNASRWTPPGRDTCVTSSR